MKPRTACTPVQRAHIANRLSRARDFIEDNYHLSIRLDDVAAKAFMSSTHFLRRFKQRFGITPHRYLTACRLRAAQAMLTRTKMAISDIAYASGFGNRCAFSRLFKARLSVSPMAYRKHFTATVSIHATSSAQREHLNSRSLSSTSQQIA